MVTLLSSWPVACLVHPTPAPHLNLEEEGEGQCSKVLPTRIMCRFPKSCKSIPLMYASNNMLDLVSDGYFIHILL